MTHLASFLFGDAESGSGDEPNEFDEFNDQLKCTDKPRLLQLGRELVKGGNYLKAELLYNRLTDYEEMKGFAGIYLKLIKLKRTPRGLEGIAAKKEDIIQDSMRQSMQMHSEGRLFDKDLINFESLIDELITEIALPDYLRQSYTNFKDYIIQNT